MKYIIFASLLMFVNSNSQADQTTNPNAPGYIGSTSSGTFVPGLPAGVALAPLPVSNGNPAPILGYNPPPIGVPISGPIRVGNPLPPRICPAWGCNGPRFPVFGPIQTRNIGEPSNPRIPEFNRPYTFQAQESAMPSEGVSTQRVPAQANSNTNGEEGIRSFNTHTVAK
jgi:hypothetical protein